MLLNQCAIVHACLWSLHHCMRCRVHCRHYWQTDPSKWTLQYRFSDCVEKLDIKYDGGGPEKIRRRRDWSVTGQSTTSTPRKFDAVSRRNSMALGSMATDDVLWHRTEDSYGGDLCIACVVLPNNSVLLSADSGHLVLAFICQQWTVSLSRREWRLVPNNKLIVLTLH